MKFLGLVMLLSLAVAPLAKADTFQVTSGYIAINSFSGGNSWALYGDNFSEIGSGDVGICGVETPLGSPVTPCGGQNTVILGGSTLITPAGQQELGVDGFFNVSGSAPFTPDGSSTFTYIAPVTFSGKIVGCFPLCLTPSGITDYFDLTGDTGYLTMVLTLATDSQGNPIYEKTSEIYTITGHTVATPEPGTLGFLLAGLGTAALWFKRKASRPA